MAEGIRESSNAYHFSTYSQLEKILVENGWNRQWFLTPEVQQKFTERKFSEADIKKLVDILNSAKSEFEQNSLLNSIARGDLMESIGQVYSFKSLRDLCTALDSRNIKYPKSYLQQDGSTFVMNFNAPRNLTKDRYEKLITELTSITGDSSTDDARRGEIIRAAFGEPVSVENTWVTGVTLLAVKNEFEKKITGPVSVDIINERSKEIGEQNDPDTKHILTSILLGRLTQGGYILSVQSWLVVVENPQTQDTEKSKLATDLGLSLNANMDFGNFTLAQVQRVILMSTGRFGDYLTAKQANLDTSSVQDYANYIAKSYNINLSKGKSSISDIQKSKATPDEKAFLISYLNGGFAGYNLAPDAKRQLELRAQWKDLIASPQYTSTVSAVDTASGGQVSAEKVKMEQESKSTGKPVELTVETFMENPTRAITKYPWTSLALIAGSIWKFGFGKTIFGLLAWVIGIKAINEIGGETGLGKTMKDTVQEVVDGFKGKKQSDSEPDKPDTETPAESSEGEKKETVGQKYISDKIRGSEFKKLFDSEKWKQKNKNAPLQQYLDFINFDIADKPVSIFFAPDTSVFDNDKPIDSSITLPAHFELPIFKSLMRMYLTGEYMPIAGRTSEKIEANKKAIEEAKKKIGNSSSTTLKEAVTSLYISK
jgi:hypothetical protein